MFTPYGLIVILFTWACPLAAQPPTRLPPVEEGGFAPLHYDVPFNQTPYPPIPQELGTYDPQWSLGELEESSGPNVSAYKDGFFQLIESSATWIGDSPETGLDVIELDTFLRVAVPMPSEDWPLVIAPAFYLTLLNGPATTDLPNQVYEASLDFAWLPKLVEYPRRSIAVPAYRRNSLRSE